MTIEMRKVGTILDSRPAGREAYLAIISRIPIAQVDVISGEFRDIVIDFAGVEVLTPSFADEFITSIAEAHGGHVRLIHTQDNITVRKTLAFLREEWGEKVLME
ncbi:MAG: DUF4325 domain-containing protein [Candidatus Peribacteraceae bacterium]|nr:DUF4325 domain-containing protein [Candidatus Peribacteraceae bacterium]